MARQGQSTRVSTWRSFVKFPVVYIIENRYAMGTLARPACDDLLAFLVHHPGEQVGLAWTRRHGRGRQGRNGASNT